jgi:hypothetical protein
VRLVSRAAAGTPFQRSTMKGKIMPKMNALDQAEGRGEVEALLRMRADIEAT